MGQLMKPILPVLAFLLPIIVGAAGAAAQPTVLSEEHMRPSSSAPSPPRAPGLPAVQRLEAKPDTTAKRDAFLARRAARMERQKIESVAPLPAQRIVPPSSTLQSR
jgi:hypothetical protein